MNWLDFEDPRQRNWLEAKIGFSCSGLDFDDNTLLPNALESAFPLPLKSLTTSAPNSAATFGRKKDSENVLASGLFGGLNFWVWFCAKPGLNFWTFLNGVRVFEAHVKCFSFEKRQGLYWSSCYLLRRCNIIIPSILDFFGTFVYGIIKNPLNIKWLHVT